MTLLHRYTFLFLMLALLLLTSCGPGRYMTSTLTRYDISKLTVLEPASYISHIARGDGNKQMPNDSLTNRARNNVWTGVCDYLSAYYLVDQMFFDSAARVPVIHEIDQLMGYGKSSYTVDEIPYPPSIDSLMWVHDIDYAVCILHAGFTREKGNYGRQLALGITMDLVLGSGSYPTKAFSELMICILDKQNQQVAFFNSHMGEDHEPMHKNVTDKQIQRIFKQYFENK